MLNNRATLTNLPLVTIRFSFNFGTRIFRDFAGIAYVNDFRNAAFSFTGNFVVEINFDEIADFNVMIVTQKIIVIFLVILLEYHRDESIFIDRRQNGRIVVVLTQAANFSF